MFHKNFYKSLYLLLFMKKFGILFFTVMMLLSVCFVVAEDDDGNSVDATVRGSSNVRATGIGISSRTRVVYDNDFDALRYRYAQNSDEFEAAYEQLVQRIRNSDLSDEEKEALLERLRERKEKVLENMDDYKDEVKLLRERYKERAENYEDASKAFLDRVKASNLTEEQKAELRLEVEAFKIERAEFRAELDTLKNERRDTVNESRELLRMLREENLTQEEREAVRQEIAAARGELKEARQAFVDEARNLRVEYRGVLHDFISEVRENYTLRDGRNVTVKIMPNVASERAIERLRLKNCNEENNCTIDFKEVGEGNNARLRYEVKAKKDGRFLGIIRMKMDVTSEVDAETGEVVRAKKPWFAFLVNE